ncbi:MAG: calcium/sodium antiporter [Verrucomicrobiota bacterium]
MDYVYLLIGLIGLYYGAEFLVKGSSNLALRLGISPLVVGLTVVAFATSMPEVFASVKAALSGSSDLALGNVVGSNLCNIGLILGLAALLRPVTVQAQLLRFEMPILIISSGIIAIFLINGILGRGEAIALAIGILFYVIYNVYRAKQRKAETPPEPLAEGITTKNEIKGHVFIDLIFIVLGIIILVYGAKFLLEGAVNIAQTLGVTEALIGLTIVALGTSLPELATTIVAARKKEGDLAIGNAIGSCIFNNMAVLGITGSIIPLEMGELKWMDIYAMLFMVLICFPLMKSGTKLQRREGALFLFLYFGYMTFASWQQISA